MGLIVQLIWFLKKIVGIQYK